MKKSNGLNTSMLEVICTGIMAVSNLFLVGYDISKGKTKRELGLGLFATWLSALNFGIKLTSFVYERYYKPEAEIEDDEDIIPEIVEPVEEV